MKKNIDLGLLVLRIGLSVLMLTHGIPKLLAFVGGDMAVAGNPIKLGGLITSILIILAEFVAPVLIIIGLKTRMAAITVVIAMAVASLIVHAGDPIGTKEKALLFVIGFLAIALMGAGKFSMDRK
jgi:putative oxidoreductase